MNPLRARHIPLVAILLLTAGACKDEPMAAVQPRMITFETYPDGAPACANCALTDQFASLGVVFSFTSSFTTLTNAQLFQSGPIYDRPAEPTNHSATFAGGVQCGNLIMTFPGGPKRVRLQDEVPDGEVAPWTAVDGGGNPIAPAHIARSDILTYTSPFGFPFIQEVFTISDPEGVSRIVVDQNHAGCFGVLVDNLVIEP